MSDEQEVVVVRGGVPAERFLALSRQDEAPTFDSLSDGWRMYVLAERPYEAWTADPDYRDWLTQVMEATGNPVMACSIAYNDAAFVRGVSRSGYWEGWTLCGDATEELGNWRTQQAEEAGLLDEGGQEAAEVMERIEDEVLNELVASLPGLAHSATQWGIDAGYTVSADQIHALMTEPESGRFGEHLHFGEPFFFALLQQLGITKDPEQ